MTEREDHKDFRPYLSAGEYILWQGKPEKGNLLTGQDVFMIPFSLLWCGFAIFWELTALMGNAPLLFKLWGIPFVCVGLYMVFGRFFWTAFLRKRTAYAITNRKIIRIRWNKVDMLDGKHLPAIHVTAGRNGCGTITFGSEWNGSRGRQGSFPGHGVFALENVADVIRVQQLISGMEQ